MYNAAAESRQCRARRDSGSSVDSRRGRGAREPGCLRTIFRAFVCVALTLLVALHVYGYLAPSDTLDGDFTDVKYVVTELTRGLNEVNRKHQHLQTELERLSSALPAVAAAAGHAKDALQPSCNKPRCVDVRDYDRQIADFALETAGARVLDTGDTVDHVLYDSPVGYALHALTALICRGHECMNARAMIRPGALPGECWAFKGATGEATIRLLGTIRVTGVTMEHIPMHISPTREISSAPRLFQVEGLEFRSDKYPHDFGTFEFNKDGKTIQYFEVPFPSTKSFNLVRLRVLSNWGHPVFTCVYRFRVHGDLAPGQLPIGDDDLRIENE